MKKFIMVSMIALIAAFGFIGCGQEDNTKADIKWTNTATNINPVTDITWVKSSKIDQTWNGTIDNDGSETDSKGVSELVGSGECFIGAAPAEIEIDPASEGVATTDGFSATIEENAAANLLIVDAQAK